jgi:hypothetical protein
MSLEQISELVKLVGLVAGGLWAAWTFHKLQKVRTAELENNKTLAAIQKSRIEEEELRLRLLRQQPQLAIQLQVTETGLPTETYGSILCITVVLKNEGEQNLRIEFEPPTLTVGRMVVEKKQEQTMDVRRFGPLYFVPESDDPQLLRDRILRVGQQRQMVLAAIPITEPACYVVQFHAVYGKIPFDGQEASGEEPVLISAVEQAMYFATANMQQSDSVTRNEA